MFYERTYNVAHKAVVDPHMGYTPCLEIHLALFSCKTCNA